MMFDSKKCKKILVMALIMGGILCLHYFTRPEMRYHHAVHRMLFYLPLILGSFWFGLKGALFVTGSVVLFWLLSLIKQFNGFSFSYEVFEQFLEIALYFVIGLILGFLVERKRKKHMNLLQAESLAAIERTVSEIAHDVKTPLIAIGGLVAQVSRNLHNDDPSRKKLDLVLQETDRLESIVKEMLDFNRPLDLQPAKTSLNDLIHESMGIVQEIARKAGVELMTDLDPSLPCVMLDGRRAKQLFLNLITNAVQASPHGENVLVRTRAGRNGVVLEVADRGCGIKEEYQEIVFKPFFSTKKGGTGLGLAIVKKIVEAHGGEISFQPNPEGGTIFIVRFPFERCQEKR